MEFIETVNLQFAIPVLGVFICAALVFAFGFKSPVAPPSALYENLKSTDRKSRRAKRNEKQQKKLLSNGHVTNNSTFSRLSEQKAEVKTEQLEKDTEQSEEILREKEIIFQKKIAPEYSPEELENVEWTTPKSRKGRKTRGKKHVDTDVQVTESHVQAPMPIEKVIAQMKEATVLEPPKEQRLSKSQEPKEVEVLKDAPRKEQENVKEEKQADISNVTASDKSNEKKEKVLPKKKSKVAEPPAKAMSMQLTADLSDAAAAQLFVEQQLREASKDLSPTIETKKKSLMAKKVAAPKPAQVEVVPEEQILNQPTAPSSQVEKSTEVSKAEPSPKKGKVKTAASNVQSENVTFDELGDWQEVKPSKKKKKSRRDN